MIDWAPTTRNHVSSEIYSVYCATAHDRRLHLCLRHPPKMFNQRRTLCRARGAVAWQVAPSPPLRLVACVVTRVVLLLVVSHVRGLGVARALGVGTRGPQGRHERTLGA